MVECIMSLFFKRTIKIDVIVNKTPEKLPHCHPNPVVKFKLATVKILQSIKNRSFEIRSNIKGITTETSNMNR